MDKVKSASEVKPKHLHRPLVVCCSVRDKHPTLNEQKKKYKKYTPNGVSVIWSRSYQAFCTQSIRFHGSDHFVFVRRYKTRWQYRRSGYFGEWRSIITVVTMCSSGLEKTCRFLQSGSSAENSSRQALLCVIRHIGWRRQCQSESESENSSGKQWRNHRRK